MKSPSQILLILVIMLYIDNINCAIAKNTLPFKKTTELNKNLKKRLKFNKFNEVSTEIHLKEYTEGKNI